MKVAKPYERHIAVSNATNYDDRTLQALLGNESERKIVINNTLIHSIIHIRLLVQQLTKRNFAIELK